MKRWLFIVLIAALALLVPASAEDALPEAPVGEIEVALGDVPAPAEPTETFALASAAAVADGIPLDAAHFPDEVFLECLNRRDGNGDGALSASEIESITALRLANKGITDLAGLQYLTALTVLDISGNAVEALDLGGNPGLRRLECVDAGMAALSLDGASGLEALICDGNLLERLDLSGCPRLAVLSCADCGMIALKLGAGLVRADCSDNALTALDASGCPKLEVLKCGGNLLSALTLCPKGALVELNCAGNGLTRLDVSGLEALTALNCAGNALSELALTGCKALRTLDCAENDLDRLDLSGLALGEAIAGSDAERVGGVVRYARGEYRLTADAFTGIVAETPPEAYTMTKSGKRTVNIGARFRVDGGTAAVTGFKSSKPKIAAVAADGTVTALAAGKTSVTFTRAKKKLTLTLTVVDPTLPTKLTFNEARTVKLADYRVPYRLKYTLYPEGTAASDITWTASPKGVVTISPDGLVTAAKAGKVTVTAVAVRNKKAKASVKLDIADPTMPTKLTLPPGKAVTLDLEDTLTLTAALLPGGTAISDIAWTPASSKVARLEVNGNTAELIPKKAGTVTVAATAARNKKVKASVKVTFKDLRAARKITIDQGKSLTLSLSAGDTARLTTTIVPVGAGYVPRQNVKWTVKPAGVVQFDPATGSVTPVAAGTVKLTATTDNKKSAAITIKVKK